MWVGGRFDRLADWLVDWLADGLVDWLADWWVDWLADWLAGWWVDGLADWWVDGLVDWLAGWWVDWWVDGLVDGLGFSSDVSLVRAALHGVNSPRTGSKAARRRRASQLNAARRGPIPMSRRTAGLPGAPLAPPPRRVAARDNVAGPAGLDVHQLLAAEMRDEIRAERAAAERAARAAAERPRPSASRKDRDVDVHELLVGELRGERAETRALREEREELSLPDPTDVYGVSDQYLVLDSWHKVRSSRTERGEFAFNFMVQGVTGDQVIGVRDRIDNVIQIQIGSFVMPRISDVPYKLQPWGAGADPTQYPVLEKMNTNNTTLYDGATPVRVTDPTALNTSGTLVAAYPPILTPTIVDTGFPYGQYPLGCLTFNAFGACPWLNNPYSQTPFGGRITVQIVEAGLQSYSDPLGARHHFEHALTFGAVIGANPTSYVAVPACGGAWDTFTFTDPLRDLHGCTLVIKNPDTPINFAPDVYFGLQVFPAAGGLQFTCPDGDGLLAVGDRVFIRNFSWGYYQQFTGSPAQPARWVSQNPILDNYVNRPEGQTLAYYVEKAAPAMTGVYIAPKTYVSFDPNINVSALSTTQAPPPDGWINGPLQYMPFDMYIAKRRLRIPIRVRRVVDRRTNYISP